MWPLVGTRCNELQSNWAIGHMGLQMFLKTRLSCAFAEARELFSPFPPQKVAEIQILEGPLAPSGESGPGQSSFPTCQANRQVKGDFILESQN